LCEEATWLRLYALGTPGIAVWGCASYILGDDTEVQPDLSVTLKPPGLNPATVRSPFNQHPKLVVEVAYSSRAYDLFEKKSLYEECGVEEYLVVSLAQSRVYWFGRRDGAYRELQPDANQVLQSSVFPGLWLNVPAFFTADLAAVQATLQQGLATQEHADFVEALKRQFPSN
jgi:Uma2 family endonuclease